MNMDGFGSSQPLRGKCTRSRDGRWLYILLYEFSLRLHTKKTCLAAIWRYLRREVPMVRAVVAEHNMSC